MKSETSISIPKPICPTCHRKTVNHYVRSKKHGYRSVGYWCINCETPVDNERSVDTFNVKSIYKPKKSTHFSDVIQQISDIEFTYLQQPPRKWTFQNPEVRKWVESHSTGKVLNLFAGRVRLSLDEIRVDLDEKYHPDFQMSAQDFVKWAIEKQKKFDTVILDPPYSHRKGWELYNGHNVNHLTRLKNSIPEILNEDSIVITLGYDSIGMGKVRGFRKEAIALVCHGRLHKDTIIMEEVMVSRSLPDQT